MNLRMDWKVWLSPHPVFETGPSPLINTANNKKSLLGYETSKHEPCVGDESRRVPCDQKEERGVSDKRTVSLFPVGEYRIQKYGLQDQVLMMPENQRIKNTSKDNLQYICYRREQQHSGLMVNVREGIEKKANGEKREMDVRHSPWLYNSSLGCWFNALLMMMVMVDVMIFYGGTHSVTEKQALQFWVPRAVCIDGNKKTKGKAVGKKKLGAKASFWSLLHKKPVSKLHITVRWTCFFSLLCTHVHGTCIKSPFLKQVCPFKQESQKPQLNCIPG